MTRLTFAVCTFNRAERLKGLLPAMRAQRCPVPFEVLVVDNNSTDGTREVVAAIASKGGTPMRYVHEPLQGIPYARNRALEEAMDSEYFVFMDDDEIPQPGLLEAAVSSLTAEGAMCAGGKVKVVFGSYDRPAWLRDELLGFLAEVDYGDEPFWIEDAATPVWTANVAYRMDVFRERPDLRFDARYIRRGHGVGGGEDVMMFLEFLKRGLPIRYCPAMLVEHFVEPWRLTRRYFLRVHFESGRKTGRFSEETYRREVLGVPPFMLAQALGQTWQASGVARHRYQGWVRQAMNAAHAWGAIVGRVQRWRAGAKPT
jgi:glycosyltransferase involved in cell wall biosynthesis